VDKMKKLLFLILFFSINVLTFSANVYFLNGGPGYVYTNGQTFYSTQGGSATVAYWIWADPAKYTVDEWGANFQDPAGNWLGWSQLSGSQGLKHCLKAGTWHVKGRVHVHHDIWGYTDYYMETSFTLYFYVVDNYAPSAPQNLTVTQSVNNHPQLSWTPNSELDLLNYRIYKKITSELGFQYLNSTTNSSYEDPTETYPYPGGQGTTHTIWYYVKAVDINSNLSDASNTVATNVSGASPEKIGHPIGNIIEKYSLEQNYPNPFNPLTTIRYTLPEAGEVRLTIYNILGEEVAALVSGFKDAGMHTVDFDASQFNSGLYIYKLEAGRFIQVKKMILLK
jgi:hypothetical protein